MTPRDREQRHHAMTSGEEHYALVWLRDHRPDAFDRAADYVDRIRALDERGVRKEARMATPTKTLRSAGERALKETR